MDPVKPNLLLQNEQNIVSALGHELGRGYSVRPTSLTFHSKEGIITRYEVTNLRTGVKAVIDIGAYSNVAPASVGPTYTIGLPMGAMEQQPIRPKVNLTFQKQSSGEYGISAETATSLQRTAAGIIGGFTLFESKARGANTPEQALSTSFQEFHTLGGRPTTRPETYASEGARIRSYGSIDVGYTLIGPSGQPEELPKQLQARLQTAGYEWFKEMQKQRPAAEAVSPGAIKDSAGNTLTWGGVGVYAFKKINELTPLAREVRETADPNNPFTIKREIFSNDPSKAISRLTVEDRVTEAMMYKVVKNRQGQVTNIEAIEGQKLQPGQRVPRTYQSAWLPPGYTEPPTVTPEGWAFGPSPASGVIFSYFNKSIDPRIQGMRPGTTSFKLPEITIADLLSGEAKLDLRPDLKYAEYGIGAKSVYFGEYSSGGVTYPLQKTKSANPLYIVGGVAVIPAFVNDKGQAVRSEAEGRSTEEYIPLLQQKLGLPIERGTVDTISVQFNVLRQVMARPRGAGTKGEVSEVPTEFNVMFGTSKASVRYFTEEMKTAASVYQYFYSRTPEQTRYLFSEYSKLEGTPEAKGLYNWILKATRPDAGPIDVIGMGKSYKNIMSKQGKDWRGVPEQIFLDVFSKVIEGVGLTTPESKNAFEARNITNFQKARAGVRDNPKIPLDAVSLTNYDMLYRAAETRIRSLPGHANDTPAQIKGYVDQVYEVQPPTAGSTTPRITMHPQSRMTYMEVSIPYTSDWVWQGTKTNKMAQLFLSIMYPNYAKEMGLSLGTSERITPMQKSLQSLMGWYSWQTAIQTKNVPGAMPKEYVEVTESMAQEIADLTTVKDSNGEEVRPSKTLQSIREKVFPGKLGKMWSYFPATGAFMPPITAIQRFQKKELGPKEVNPISGIAAHAYGELAGLTRQAASTPDLVSSTPELLREWGVQAVHGLYSFMDKLEKAKAATKAAFSKVNPEAIGSRVSLMLGLESNEQNVSSNFLKWSLKGHGISGKNINKLITSPTFSLNTMFEGEPALGPDPVVRGYIRNELRLAQVYGPEKAKRIINSPTYQNLIHSGLSFGDMQRDWDGDPAHLLPFGFTVDKKGDVIPLSAEALAEIQPRTPQEAAALKRLIGEDPAVNAAISELSKSAESLFQSIDPVTGKVTSVDPVLKALKKPGFVDIDTIKIQEQYSKSKGISVGMANLMNAPFAANVLMRAGATKEEFMAALSAGPAMQTAAVDALTSPVEASGARIPSLIAKANFGLDKNSQPVLRTFTSIPYEISIKGKKIRLQEQLQMNISNIGTGAVDKLISDAIALFTEKTKLASGESVNLAGTDFLASQFALPKDQATIKAELQATTPDKWRGVLNKYKEGLRSGTGMDNDLRLMGLPIAEELAAVAYRHVSAAKPETQVAWNALVDKIGEPAARRIIVQAATQRFLRSESIPLHELILAKAQPDTHPEFKKLIGRLSGPFNIGTVNQTQIDEAMKIARKGGGVQVVSAAQVASQQLTPAQVQQKMDDWLKQSEIDKLVPAQLSASMLNDDPNTDAGRANLFHRLVSYISGVEDETPYTKFGQKIHAGIQRLVKDKGISAVPVDKYGHAHSFDTEIEMKPVTIMDEKITGHRDIISKDKSVLGEIKPESYTSITNEEKYAIQIGVYRTGTHEEQPPNASYPDTYLMEYPVGERKRWIQIQSELESAPKGSAQAKALRLEAKEIEQRTIDAGFANVRKVTKIATLDEIKDRIAAVRSTFRKYALLAKQKVAEKYTPAKNYGTAIRQANQIMNEFDDQLNATLGITMTSTGAPSAVGAIPPGGGQPPVIPPSPLSGTAASTPQNPSNLNFTPSESWQRDNARAMLHMMGTQGGAVPSVVDRIVEVYKTSKILLANVPGGNIDEQIMNVGLPKYATIFGPQGVNALRKIPGLEDKMKFAFGYFSRNAGEATSEQMTRMRNLVQGTPGTEGETFRQSLAELGGVSKALVDQGIKGKGEEVGIPLAAESLTKLTESVKDFTKATMGATPSVKDMEKAMIGIRGSTATGAMQAVQQRILQIGGEVISQGGQVTVKQAKEIGSLQREYSSLEKSAAKASMEEVEKGPGGAGRFFRRTLGGWGLMYARSIAGFITGGQGYGYEEAAQLEQISGTAGAQLIGAHQVPYSQAQKLKNQMAIVGSQYNAKVALQQIRAESGIINDIMGTAEAGVGAYAGMQFLSMSSTGGAAAAIGAAALPVAAGVAALSLGATAYTKSQDPGSLAYRTTFGGFGLGGVTDALARFRIAANLGGQDQNAWKNNLQWAQQAKYQIDTKAPMGTSLRGMSTEQALATYSIRINEAIRGTSITQEAAAQAVSWMTMANLPLDNVNIRRYASDFQTGVGTPDLATTMLSAAGYSQAVQLQVGAGGQTFAGAAAERMMEKPITLPEKMAMLAGVSNLEKLGPAGRYMPGAREGAGGGSPAIFNRNMDQLGGLQGNGLDLYAGYAQTWLAQTQAGMNVGEMLAPSQKYTQRFTPQETAAIQATQTAQFAQAQYRTGVSQTFMNQAYQFGRAGLGEQLRNQILQVTPGQEWAANKLLSGDPLMIATMAATNPAVMSGLAQQAPLITGAGISYQDLFRTGINPANNMPTGLPWGKTSFATSTTTANQFATRLWGGMNGVAGEWMAPAKLGLAGGLAGAMINGVSSGLYNLPGLPTDASGQSIVGGEMGGQLKQMQNQLSQAKAQAGIQMQQIQQNLAFTTGVGLEKYYGTVNPQTGQAFGQLFAGGQWGLEDAQRNLSIRQQESSFGFQQQGLNIGMKQFQENMGLNRQGMTMQRGWTQEDWQYQSTTRGLQWQWKQEDFREQSRFMTGRERRLAERQMGRETTMYNIEGEQIEKQKDRQKEIWELEDRRFATQIRQYKENTKFQQDQLDTARKFFKESTALDEEAKKLQRASFIANMDLQKQSAGMQVYYAQKAFDEQKLLWDLQMEELTKNGAAALVTDDYLMGFQQTIANVGSAASSATPGLKGLIDELLRLPGANIGNGGGNTGSGSTRNPDYPEKAIGGNINQTGWTLVGERGAELLAPGGSIYSHEQTSALERMTGLTHNMLGQSILVPMNKGGKSSGQTINVYVGNEKLATFVVDTINKELRA
jgi:hypothetical protein